MSVVTDAANLLNYILIGVSTLTALILILFGILWFKK